MTTLNKISEDLQSILTMVEEGTIPAEQAGDLLEQMEGELEDKLIGYAHAIENANADIDAFKQKEKNIAARRKAAENNLEFLKRNLIDKMQKHALKKIENHDIRVTLRKNKAKVVIDDCDAIPAEYVTTKVTVTPNKFLIKDVLDSGTKIDGVHMEDSFSLLIK
jgi:hypothetical protein